jgi:UDP-N-acetylmuramoyl-L-alanine---L-glutamate ligase
MRLADLADARVAVWGYGREGQAALAALRKQFPHKSLSLICAGAEADGLIDPQVDLLAFEPDAALLERFDVVIKSPGISPYRSPVPEAEADGVSFVSGTELWFAEHPDARTICVTGTKGKSTTAALIAHLLRRTGKRVALAGNIGLPLLQLLHKEADCWVIELSSFQTRGNEAQASVLLVNNLFPEHLDWHGSLERYYSDKLTMVPAAQRLVVNAQQPELMQRTSRHPARTTFGTPDGWHVDDATICFADRRVLAAASLPLAGLHNANNVCAALAALDALDEDSARLAAGVADFAPLPHRLQRLGSRNGIEFINDSIATTPHATLAALDCYRGRPLVLILGGFDRGLDWSWFPAALAGRHDLAIVTQGQNGSAIADLLRPLAERRAVRLHEAQDFAAAITTARKLAVPGAIVLLSPGAPSFGQFRDYAERGREFARLAGFDIAAASAIAGLGIA